MARTCTQDFTHVSGTSDADGCTLNVYRVRWTTSESLARRHLFTSVRYRDAATGDFVAPNDDLSAPAGAVAEYGFLTPMSDHGRTFADQAEAWAFALERGYLQRFYVGARLRAERVARSQATPRCACGQPLLAHKGHLICAQRECPAYGDSQGVAA